MVRQLIDLFHLPTYCPFVGAGKLNLPTAHLQEARRRPLSCLLCKVACKMEGSINAEWKGILQAFCTIACRSVDMRTQNGMRQLHELDSIPWFVFHSFISSFADSNLTGIRRVVDMTESDEDEEELRRLLEKSKGPILFGPMPRRSKKAKKKTIQEEETEEEGDHIEPNRKTRSKRRPSTAFEDGEEGTPTDASTECV